MPIPARCLQRIPFVACPSSQETLNNVQVALSACRSDACAGLKVVGTDAVLSQLDPGLQEALDNSVVRGEDKAARGAVAPELCCRQLFRATCGGARVEGVAQVSQHNRKVPRARLLSRVQLAKVSLDLLGAGKRAEARTSDLIRRGTRC